MRALYPSMKSFRSELGWEVKTYHDGKDYISYVFQSEVLWRKCVAELQAQGYREESA